MENDWLWYCDYGLTLVKVHPGKKYRTMIIETMITRNSTHTTMVLAEGREHDLKPKKKKNDIQVKSDTWGLLAYKTNMSTWQSRTQIYSVPLFSCSTCLFKLCDLGGSKMLLKLGVDQITQVFRLLSMKLSFILFLGLCNL